MQLNLVNSLIAILVSAILAYALWSLDGELKNYVAIGGFVFFAGTLFPMIGGSYQFARSGVNLRIVSGVFFGLGVVINGVFSIASLSATAYIVISSLTFLTYIFLANAVFGTGQ